MAHNVDGMKSGGLRSAKLSNYNNFKNENKC